MEINDRIIRVIISNHPDVVQNILVSDSITTIVVHQISKHEAKVVNYDKDRNSKLLGEYCFDAGLKFSDLRRFGIIGALSEYPNNHYITFIDDDDRISDNWYQLAVTEVNDPKNYDIILNRIEIFEYGEGKENNITTIPYSNIFESFLNHEFGPYLHGHLYRIGYIRNFVNVIPTDARYFDDLPLTFVMLKNTDNISVIDSKYYYNRTNPYSETVSEKSENYLRLYEMFKDWIIGVPEDSRELYIEKFFKYSLTYCLRKNCIEF